MVAKLVKEYYVIQNKEGKFFHTDSASGGYPSFLSSFESCEKFFFNTIYKFFFR